MKPSTRAFQICCLVVASFGWIGCSAQAIPEPNDRAVAAHGDDLTEHPALTPPQAATIVRLLNDACGDSWCEGEHEWSFTDIACSFPENTCVIRLFAVDTSTSQAAGTKHWRTIEVGGCDSYASIVGAGAGGWAWLQTGFWIDVDTEMAKLSRTIP